MPWPLALLPRWDHWEVFLWGNVTGAKVLGAVLVSANQAKLRRNMEASSSWEGKMARKSKIPSSLIPNEVRGQMKPAPLGTREGTQSVRSSCHIEQSPDTLFRVFVRIAVRAGGQQLPQ